MKGKLPRFLIVLVVLCAIGGAVSACDDANLRTLNSVTEMVTVGSYDGPTSYEVFAPAKDTVHEDQPIVAKDLADFVNSGYYNITRVETTYTDGCLTAARVDYRHDQLGGSGNNLRVKLDLPTIDSDVCIFADHTKQLAKLSSDTANVYRVNTVFYNGFLVAGEVWYMVL